MIEIIGEENTIMNVTREEDDSPELTAKQLRKLEETSERISDGANTFLMREYLYLLIFIIVFALIIFFFGEHTQWTAYTTIAFLIGSGTSILCGFIGMKIATASNYRTTYSAYYGLGEAFKVAYHGGCVMGFMLVSISLLVLMTLIIVYRAIYLNDKSTLTDQRIIGEAIAGYGLGGSLVALFCRVGGGIYTKAADVGSDLVGKIEMGIDEDDPSNPAVIADNVGDNVGDIAGMGSDLFGSLAESLTAALLVGSTSPELMTSGNYFYPLLIIAFGIVISIITSFFAFFFANRIKNYSGLENTIKLQLIISTILSIPAIVLLSIYGLPQKYSIGQIGTVTYKPNVTNYLTMTCPILGLVSGLLIGLSTEYYTSMSYRPVRKLVDGCKQGAGINIILGLALGYLSTIIPTILITVTVLVSYSVAGMYGISLASLGMLANLPICLAIDAYGPISDNAGGLASLCELPASIRDITDDLDSAGNTTAAIGKGFAIGSACLVALALFGAFVTKTNLQEINALIPIILTGLLIGAMMPYLFSALTMKAVGVAAESMVEVCRKSIRPRQLKKEEREDKEIERNTKLENGESVEKLDDEIKELEKEEKEMDDRNSNECVKISTDNSLSQMFLPGGIIIFVPMFVGILFGTKCVAGYLIGVIISGIQMAISASNSGGAWDNAKKLIKTKGLPMSAKETYELQRADLMQENNPDRKETLEYINSKLKKIDNEKYDTPQHDEMITNNHPFYVNCKKMQKLKKLAEKSSIIGDTVGDPMKDTSGPSLNILIKLSSIISVVFGTLFMNTSYVLK